MAFVAGAGSAVAAQGDAQWLGISDIHLDPYDRSERVAGPGSDSNLALLDSALAAMRRTAPHPAMVVVPGDFLAHRFATVVARNGRGVGADAAGIAAMRAIAAAFDRSFPHAQFALALGNNDAPCGDYASDLGGRFLSAVSRAWTPLVDRNGAAPAFARTFASGGHYTLDLAGAPLRIVAIDSVLFSIQYRGACAGADADAPARELVWLRDSLRGLPANRHAVIVMHVPPGYDAFATELTQNLIAWPYMTAAWNAALLQVLRQYAGRVRFIVAGHAHRFDVRLVEGIPTVVLGSLSPVYRNSPVFYRFSVGPDATLRDVNAYAYDARGGRWNAPHSLAAAWNAGAIDARAMRVIHLRLGRQPVMRAAWEAQSTGWAGAGSGAMLLWTGSLWKAAWCAQTLIDERFVRCADIDRRDRDLSTAVIVFGIAALAVSIAGVVVIVRSRANR